MTIPHPTLKSTYVMIGNASERGEGGRGEGERGGRERRKGKIGRGEWVRRGKKSG